jgi:hypothetical protein
MQEQYVENMVKHGSKGPTGRPPSVSILCASINTVRLIWESHGIHFVYVNKYCSSDMGKSRFPTHGRLTRMKSQLKTDM